MQQNPKISEKQRALLVADYAKAVAQTKAKGPKPDMQMPVSDRYWLNPHTRRVQLLHPQTGKVLKYRYFTVYCVMMWASNGIGYPIGWLEVKQDFTQAFVANLCKEWEG